MTNDELDSEIETQYQSTFALVMKLANSRPNIEQAVALGGLCAALAILNSLRKDNVTVIQIHSIPATDPLGYNSDGSPYDRTKG